MIHLPQPPGVHHHTWLILSPFKRALCVSTVIFQGTELRVSFALSWDLCLTSTLHSQLACACSFNVGIRGGPITYRMALTLCKLFHITKNNKTLKLTLKPGNDSMRKENHKTNLRIVKVDGKFQSRWT